MMKKIWCVAFFILLFGGTVMSMLGITLSNVDLNGVYADEGVILPPVRDSVNEILNGSYMQTIEEKWESSYALRAPMIKLNNTIEFLLGHSANDNVWLLGNYNLFEGHYLMDVTVSNDNMDGQRNREAIRAQVRELDYVRSCLEKLGIESYVFITPNKASYYMDDVRQTALYKTGKIASGESVRNIDVLREELKDAGIPFTDSSSIIQSGGLPEQVSPFVRSGIHYTWAAAYYLMEELFDDIEQTLNIDMPEFSVRVEQSSEVIFPNSDLYDLQNTYHFITDWIYSDVIQQRPYAEDLIGVPTKVVAQGGSFLGPMIDFVIRYPEALAWMDIIQNNFYYGHNQQYTLSEISDVDIKTVLSSDLIIFEVCEDQALGMSFGFIEYLADYFRSTNDASINNYIEYPSELQISRQWINENEATSYGLYFDAVDFGWAFTCKRFGCVLQNNEIGQKGLCVRTTVLPQLIEGAPGGIVQAHFVINQTDVGDYPVSDDGTIVIPANQIPINEKGIYSIDVEVNSSFIPSEVNPESLDGRELSLILISISANK